MSESLEDVLNEINGARSFSWLQREWARDNKAKFNLSDYSSSKFSTAADFRKLQQHLSTQVREHFANKAKRCKPHKGAKARSDDDESGPSHAVSGVSVLASQIKKLMSDAESSPGEVVVVDEKTKTRVHIYKEARHSKN